MRDPVNRSRPSGTPDFHHGVDGIVRQFVKGKDLRALADSEALPPAGFTCMSAEDGEPEQQPSVDRPKHVER